VIHDTLVVVGDNGVAAYSTDGLRWYDVTLPIRGNLTVITNTRETVFIASSDGGIYAASGLRSDNWEVVQTADIRTWTSAYSANDTVVFVGRGGTVMVYDGTTHRWKSGPPSSAQTSYYACAQIQPGEWAVVGDSGIFRTTTDFDSWAEEERVIPVKQVPGHPSELMRIDALSQIYVQNDGTVLVGGHGYRTQISLTETVNTYGIHVRIAKGTWKTAYFEDVTDSGYYVHNILCRGIVASRTSDNILTVVSSAVNDRGNIVVYSGNAQDTLLRRTSLLTEGSIVARGNKGYLNEFIREYVSGVAVNDSTFLIGVTMKNVSFQQEIEGVNNYVLQYQVLPDTIRIDTSLVLPDTASGRVLMVRKGLDVLVATATNALIRSKDGGATWPDTIVIGGYSGNIVKLNASDERIVVYMQDSLRSALLYSNDDGQSWSNVDFGGDSSVYLFDVSVDVEGTVRILYLATHPTLGRRFYCNVLDGLGRLLPQEPELPEYIQADQPYITSTFGTNPFSFTAVVQRDGVYQPIVVQLDKDKAAWKIIDPVFQDEIGNSYTAYEINGSVLTAGFQNGDLRATAVRRSGNIAVATPTSETYRILDNQMTAKSLAFSHLIPLKTSVVGVSRYYGPIQFFLNNVTSAPTTQHHVSVASKLIDVNILKIPSSEYISIVEVTNLNGKRFVFNVPAGTNHIDLRDLSIPTGLHATLIRQESNVVRGLILVVP